MLCLCISLSAQERLTFAESASQQWKGIDVTTVLNNTQYAEKGKKFYLYNVGTGYFIIDGGNWGIEGRLFYNTFGRLLELMSNGNIKSGITEKTVKKIMYGCNVPRLTRPTATWNDADKYSFTTIMDAETSSFSKWKFQRVETDPSDDTYTYYMWEVMGKDTIPNKNYYLGAAYGEYHNISKGDGQFVYLDDDRACWTTGQVIDNDIEYEVRGDMIPIKKLYQWRLISEEEFNSILYNDSTGLNPNISGIIPDRDFTRNAENWDSSWLTRKKTDYSYSDIGRYGYKYGFIYNKKKQDTYYPDHSWDEPVRLKTVFENGDLTYGLKNAKFGYMSFEGVGETYTTFIAPRAGWYQIQCYGFIQSDTNDAYLFARANNNEHQTNIVRIPSGTYTNINKISGCLNVGKELTFNGQDYINTVWVCVTEDNNIIEIGIGKNNVVKSNNIIKNDTTYCYDTDMVCVDNFQVQYMGYGPAFFYDNESSLDYLHHTSEKQYLPLCENGRYNGSINIVRNFKTGQWNSFTFPLPLTGEQIRAGFGEDTKMVQLHSIGNVTKNSNVIDFVSVDLHTSDNVVLPGKIYMIQPSADPSVGIGPDGQTISYYQIGRMSFSTNGTEPNEYKYPIISLEKYTDISSVPSYKNENNGMAYAMYTTGYAPKNSYVVSNNTIYKLSINNPIKAFRGYITLDNETGMQTAMMKIFDKESISTNIENIIENISVNDNIYNILGQKVTNPSKGLYIINGRKRIIK